MTVLQYKWYISLDIVRYNIISIFLHCLFRKYKVQRKRKNFCLKDPIWWYNWMIHFCLNDYVWMHIWLKNYNQNTMLLYCCESGNRNIFMDIFLLDCLERFTVKPSSRLNLFAFNSKWILRIFLMGKFEIY